MLFLQARLLDNAMVLKHRYGKISSVNILFVSVTFLVAFFQNNKTLSIPLLLILRQWPYCVNTVHEAALI